MKQDGDEGWMQQQHKMMTRGKNEGNLLGAPGSSIPRQLGKMNQIVEEVGHHIQRSLCPSETIK